MSVEESLDPCTSAHRRANILCFHPILASLMWRIRTKVPTNTTAFCMVPPQDSDRWWNCLFACLKSAYVLRSHPACRYCLGVAGPQNVTREMQSRVTEAPAASRKPARGAAMSADAAFLQIRILPPVRTWRIPALPTNNATSVFGICLSGYQQQSPLFGSGNDLCSVRVEMAQCRVCAPWPELELGSEHQSFGPPQTSTIGVRA